MKVCRPRAGDGNRYHPNTKQMSLMLVLDNEMGDQIKPLAPHKNILDPNKPRSLTNVAEIPKPVASTISSWMMTPSIPTNDPAKLAFLAELAD